MNIITADFNWVSFLIIVIGAIIGVAKSNKRQTMAGPVVQEPDWTFDTDNAEPCEETIPSEEEKPEERYENPEEHIAEETSPAMEAIEEEQEESRAFDIRQAVISSEILRRPQF